MKLLPSKYGGSRMDPRVTKPLCKPEALPGVPALALLAPDGASCWAGKGPLSGAGTLSSCLGPGSPVLSTNLRAMLDQTIVNLLFFFLHLVEDGVCVCVCACFLHACNYKFRKSS